MTNSLALRSLSHATWNAVEEVEAETMPPDYVVYLNAIISDSERPICMWEHEAERVPHAHGTSDRDRSGVRVDQCVDNGQPEPTRFPLITVREDSAISPAAGHRHSLSLMSPEPFPLRLLVRGPRSPMQRTNTATRMLF